MIKTIIKRICEFTVMATVIAVISISGIGIKEVKADDSAYIY